MYNIFQGNDLIKQIIAKALGYNLPEKPIGTSFTSDIYLSAFFYLSKRFGAPSLFDDCKEAGAWAFKVKNYFIEIRMNSSWVEFMIYGKISNRSVNSHYIVKYMRERQKKRGFLLNETGNWDKTEQKIGEVLFEKFIDENNIDRTITQEQFNKDYSMKWFERICKYNNSIINVDHKAITELYPSPYQNSYTRHALKTLNQFLSNMLTPIWIRDVPYNIKGTISDNEARNYKRFENNIKIEFRAHE